MVLSSLQSHYQSSMNVEQHAVATDPHKTQTWAMNPPES